MNCFQLVKTVLDEIYDQIPFNSELAKDQAIINRLALMGPRYRNLLGNVSPISYDDPVTRFAYICRYVTSHANMVYTLIGSSSILSALFDFDKIDVTCIGGGPGSDLLGILKFMLNQQKSATLRCLLYDKEQAWGDSWNDVDDKLSAPFRVSTFFQPFDVALPNTWAQQTKYLNSDLFTLVYFMSEIHRVKNEAEPFFTNLFSKSKQGALFLYVDNDNSTFYDWFDAMVRQNALRVLDSNSTKLGMDWDEEKRDLGRYYAKFGNPKLEGEVAYRICQKC